MTVDGIGEKNDWNDILIINNSRKNIVATNVLVSRGYGLDSGRETIIYKLDDESKTPVLKCEMSNGMPYVLLSELFRLKKLQFPDVEMNHVQMPQYSPPQYSPEQRPPYSPDVVLDNEGDEDEYYEEDEEIPQLRGLSRVVRDGRDTSPVVRHDLGAHIAGEGRGEELARQIAGRLHQLSDELALDRVARATAEEQYHRDVRRTTEDLFGQSSDDEDGEDSGEKEGVNST
jgi:hypothetical protein